MTVLEDELRTALHARAETMRVPERPRLGGDIRMRDAAADHRGGLRRLVAAACLALVVAGLALLSRHPDNDRLPPVDSIPDTTVPETTSPDTTGPDPTEVESVTNGWLAVDQVAPIGGRDIHLIRPGGEPRLLEIEGPDTADDSCPVWSPDARRLMIGRLVGPTAQLVIADIGVDASVGETTVIPLDGFGVLPSFDPHPCGIWASDGRWVALEGAGEVWVVDTRDGEIRRLPGLRPSDLEWRPGTDELAITGDLGAHRSARTLSTSISIYSVDTDTFRTLGTTVAAHLSWSPDGSQLAYTGGETDPADVMVVDADGTNQRKLASNSRRPNHGIGPVWSPRGDLVAFQRGIGVSERSDVVLVRVEDGTTTVIDPPRTARVDGVSVWYPRLVAWSPDGRLLWYAAWSDEGDAVLTVAADAPHEVTVWTDTVYPGTDPYNAGWVPDQMWARSPG